LDILYRRNNDSLDLYQYAWSKGWQCITSVFTKLETLEVKQFHIFKNEKRKLGWKNKRIENERHNRDLSSKILGNISRSVTALIKSRCKGFKIYTSLLEDGWEIAEEIKRKTNLTDKDTLQLSEALTIACDIFVSRDESLLLEAKKHTWAKTPNLLIEIIKLSDPSV
jgi:predicted nucleic acid-binding protein